MRVDPPKKPPQKSHHQPPHRHPEKASSRSSCTWEVMGQIGEELHIPSHWGQRNRERQLTGNLPHPGHPRKTSAREDRYVIHSALSDTKVANSVLSDITNQQLSVTTIRRRLCEDGTHKWRAVKRALLTGTCQKASQMGKTMSQMGKTVETFDN